MDTTPGRPTRNEWIVAALLAGAAVALRFVRLGALSLSGDEETTALAASALLEQGWPVLPGGLVYVRGFPFTALESAAIAVFGSGEAALRALPTLFAAPRVLAAWWLARAFLSAPLALACAALLALAPLDVELSRTARMYSMFAALDLVFVAAVVHFARGGLGRAGFGLGALVGVLAALTHTLAVTHAPVAWAAASDRSLGRGRRLALVAAGAAVVVAYWAHRRLVASYWIGNVASTHGARPLLSEHLDGLGGLASAGLLALPLGLAAAVSALGGGVVALRCLTLPWARVAAGASGLAFAAGSPLLGGLAALGAAILEGRDPLKALAPLLAGGALATAAWAGGALVAGQGPGGALDLLLGYPAPNWAELALAGPAIFALAVLGSLAAPFLAARAPEPGRAAWLALVVAFAGALLVTGLYTRREGIRFHLHLVGPMLVLALVGSRVLFAALGERANRVAPALAAALALLALRPDVTLAALTREHGPTESPYVQLDVAPDHRGPGRFAAERAGPDDWIAAEDALQQQWWIGRVDVWLRKTEDAATYLRRETPDAPLRDVYTGARLAPDLEALRALAAEHGRDVVWLVTSGETEIAPIWYRTPEDDATLERWEPRAWFVGRDGLTRVYRLEAGQPAAPPAAEAR